MGTTLESHLRRRKNESNSTQECVRKQLQSSERVNAERAGCVRRPLERDLPPQRFSFLPRKASNAAEAAAAMAAAACAAHAMLRWRYLLSSNPKPNGVNRTSADRESTTHARMHSMATLATTRYCVRIATASTTALAYYYYYYYYYYYIPRHLQLQQLLYSYTPTALLLLIQQQLLLILSVSDMVWAFAQTEAHYSRSHLGGGE